MTRRVELKNHGKYQVLLFHLDNDGDWIDMDEDISARASHSRDQYALLRNTGILSLLHSIASIMRTLNRDDLRRFRQLLTQQSALETVGAISGCEQDA
jgi:hypothetical protein